VASAAGAVHGAMTWKVGFEDSESEQSWTVAPTARTIQEVPPWWSCARQRLILTAAVLVLLVAEFATLRLAHRHLVHEELRALEGKNAALQTNITVLRSIAQRSEEERALLESEMRLRTAHCGDLETEMKLLQEENADLRRNISELVAQQSLAEKELESRQYQFEAMAVRNMLLRDENYKLQNNITSLEDKNHFLQQDLEDHYQEFEDLEAALDLQSNVSAQQSNVSKGLKRSNSVLSTRLSAAETELNRAENVVIGMSQDLDVLRVRNSELVVDLMDAKGKA